ELGRAALELDINSAQVDENLGEAGGSYQFAELIRFRKSPWACAVAVGKLTSCCCAQRLIHSCEHGRVVNRRPDSNADTTAWSKSPKKLGQRGCTIREELQPLLTKRDVEAYSCNGK